MPFILFFIALLIVAPVVAQVAESGSLTAGQGCEAYQSIKKRSGATALEAGRVYPVVARNKAGGDWLLIQVEQRRLWVAQACGASRPAPVTAPKAAGFDYYTLALSWQPAFCAEHPGRSECGFATVPLALHGLWPSATRGPHPQFCDGSRKGAFCGYAPLGLEDEALDDLAQWMPGVSSCLHRYQWHKHGSCSGLSKSDYFDRSVAYTEWVRQSPPGRWLMARVGQRVARDSVLAQFDRWGKPGAVSLHCDGDVLEEVRLRLQAPLDLTPSSKALKTIGVRQRCPERLVLLP